MDILCSDCTAWFFVRNIYVHYRVSQTEVGLMAVIVDPIDKGAEKFYSSMGFILLPASGKIFLPMKTISRLF